MKKHLNFFACDPSNHKGKTNIWFTPEWVINTLGIFDMDPCTVSYRPFDTAKKHICHDYGECGLESEWNGRIWLNPPYGQQIFKWIKKLSEHGNGIALVFNRTETKWGQISLKTSNAVNFIERRIKFIKSTGETSKDNAGTGSMLLAFGENNVEAINRINGVVMINQNLKF